ncbi:hypothetical protein Desmer_0998 [Desulfosporosinus meridiei DSM 13257]|uniref:Uncharacterized protein n=2 Tax=Desulfosporosinus TaxID=79206 RepID=J7IMJ0_DESMD|nr:hypothetical protein Desmer_0998 [Desulfosporosinus meridiei DSM 13257]
MENSHPPKDIFGALNTLMVTGNDIKHNSRGYVSLLILLLLTLLAGLGMESYLKSNTENRMVKREVQSRQALYLAEGGVEWAKAHLTTNPDLRKGSLSLDNGQVDVQIELSGGDYKVTSKGLSGLAVRKIEEHLELVNDSWVSKSYQELHQ